MLNVYINLIENCSGDIKAQQPHGQVLDQS